LRERPLAAGLVLSPPEDSMRYLITLGVSVATAGAASVSLGALTAATVTGSPSITTTPFATGWEFSLDTPVTVTSLGYWDMNGDGLVKSHRVGIFRASDQQPMVSANIIDAGTLPLVDGSRIVNVPDTALQANVSYYILADDIDGDMYAFGNGAISFASHISWAGAANTTLNDIFAAASFTGGTAGNLAPNFQFNVVAPSPGVGAMVGLAAAGAGLRRRRR
jgi:hypothetical protein